MITPAELADAEEREALKEDVQAELAQFGQIVEMRLPTSGNAACEVFVRFGAPAEAAAAQAALRGRKFDGREVVVSLVPQARFEALVDGA